ncbi:GtrA family protein [Atlantibacter hermannii]|uniref:GtrA family protein n=1 Tax=Atlantibacter hermannii TaxID=565 RepID=UPI001C7007ED|nr:GtrA family protein [Atlantibacter hermannii]MBW9430751.1 GtrA family protein [Atlantibacter hermannii]
MKKMFFSYVAIGVLNTLIHWTVFFMLFNYANKDQAFSNFIAFCIAVSFSFFANSKITFRSTATITRYALYVAFMGVISISIGLLGDTTNLYPILTLVMFSVISLSCGFLYSKYIVFKDEK